jgi:hypothetical protein
MEETNVLGKQNSSIAQGTYLYSMKGSMCRIRTLRGISPPGIKGIELQRNKLQGYKLVGIHKKMVQ